MIFVIKEKIQEDSHTDERTGEIEQWWYEWLVINRRDGKGGKGDED